MAAVMRVARTPVCPLELIGGLYAGLFQAVDR